MIHQDLLTFQTFLFSLIFLCYTSFGNQCQDGRIQTVVCDVSNWTGTRDVVRGLGDIDMLVNNAAVMEWFDVIDVTEEVYDKYVRN